jgi:hypothetical protein
LAKYYGIRSSLHLRRVRRNASSRQKEKGKKMAKSKKETFDIENVGATVRVKTCSCLHGYQDERYGRFKRLHNVTKEGKWRCTVCSKIN